MRPIAILPGIAFLGGLLLVGAANGAPRTYIYTVEHPLYGNIGTYTHIIDGADGVTSIDSQLHLAVRILGVVIYREDADQIEVLRGTHLISFRSVTEKDGKQIRVLGEAKDNGFAITSPSGTILAPADVVPVNPWSLTQVGTGVVVSINSGEIDNVAVTGGEVTLVSLNGKSTRAHLFHVRTDLQPDKWEVWFNEDGVPIKVRSLEAGTPIDFLLSSPSSALRPR